MGDVEVFDAGGAAANAAGDSAHLADTVDAHDASAISVVATGDIAATDAQSAFAELSAEKLTRVHPLAPTGAIFEAFPRVNQSSSAQAIVSGTLWMVAVDIPLGKTITSLSFWSGSTAAATSTHVWFALYDSARALLRQTVDDTAASPWSANVEKNLALTSTFVTTYSGLHYIGVNVTAGTTPTLLSCTGNTGLWGKAPILQGTSNTGLTDTAPNPANALSAAGGRPYCAGF